MALSTIPKDDGKSDQAYVTLQGKARGSKDYEFTWEEIRSLKEKAVKIGMEKDIINQFEQSFIYMQKCPKWIRTSQPSVRIQFKATILTFSLFGMTISLPVITIKSVLLVILRQPSF